MAKLRVCWSLALGVALVLAGCAPQASIPQGVQVYFSPKGGATEAVVSTLAHATNVAATASGAKAFYQFAPEQLVASDPDVILLPKSMYKTDADVAAFTKDPRFAGLSAVKNNRVVVVDDVIVTRPGPRIGDGLQILADAIHPTP